MKNKRYILTVAGTVFINILLIILLIAGTVTAVFADNYTVAATQSLIDDILACKIDAAGAENLQEWLDGDLTDGAGTASEWYVIALSRYTNGLDFTAYTNALKAYMNENEKTGATTKQRCLLALLACGCEDTELIAPKADKAIGEQGIMSWVFGLHLLNNGVKSDKYSVSDVVSKILTLRLSDGGWALTGNYSDADITAMTVQALAPYYPVSSEVKSAVDGAVALLSKSQLDNGGYKSFGIENPESCAQVLVALSSVGIDALNDTRFIKNGESLLDAMMSFRCPDGAFSHTKGGASNSASTAQVLYSLISLWRAGSGLSSLYVFRPDRIPTAELSDSVKPPEASDNDGTTKPVTEGPSSLSSDNTAANVIHENSGHISGKLWACLAVLCAVLTACLILYLCKKRNYKNYVFTLFIGALVVCFILATDFKTADEYYNPDHTPKTDITGSVTITIRCDTIAGKKNSDYIPSDGIILPVTRLDITGKETVFDILTEAARIYNIQVENEGAAAGAGIYISGINYLYEADFSDLSGWVYRVNGVTTSVGCSEYILNDGDVIEWLYTCDLGNDINN